MSRLWEALAVLPVEGSVNYRSTNCSALVPQVVYPAELNGWLPTRANGQGINLLSGKSIYLKVDILQSNMEWPELTAPPLSGHSPSTSIASPVRPPPPKVKGEVSMTIEVRKFLSRVGLDMSEHASGSSTPQRQDPVVLVTPLPTKLEDFPKPVDMSS